jgi:hypothetical protein
VGAYDLQTISSQLFGQVVNCWCTPIFPPPGDGWREAVFDLSAWEGESALLRFRFGSDGADEDPYEFDGWYVDDVVIDLGSGGSMTPAVVERSKEIECSISARPNPFNPRTEIALTVPVDLPRALLEVIDVSGRRVRVLHDGPLGKGRQTRVWDGRTEAGSDVASGIYFLRMSAGGSSVVRRLYLVR